VTLTVAFFGTFERDYPRNAVLIEGLRQGGAEVLEFAAPLRHGLGAADMTTPRGAAALALDLTEAHVRLLSRHRARLAVDVVVVAYPGHLLVPFGRIFSRIRGARLVFDPLVSLFDTFAGDRGLLELRSAAGRMLWSLDHVMFRLADVVLADTDAHARFYRKALRVPEERLVVVPVGALPVADADGSARRLARGEPLVVFQYGKWSPLHGAETVLAAAAELAGEPFQFVLAGEGQLSSALRREIDERALANVEWLGMVDHDELRARSLAADVCLGVFGGSAKAARVIPNKIYDGLACGRPVVTADSPAARELLVDGESAILVPALDGAALASALQRLRKQGERGRLGAGALALYRRRCTPAAVADRLLAGLEGGA
jgi:glycosyltransferase involved in cell wall biosynthesis